MWKQEQYNQKDQQRVSVQRARFNRQKHKFAWLEHHSLCHSCCTVKRGKFKWERCPGLSRDDLTDRNKPVCVPYHRYYKCVQCSLQFGKDHYFCNAFSLGDFSV